VNHAVNLVRTVRRAAVNATQLVLFRLTFVYFAL
jgi:hypothetical protein